MSDRRPGPGSGPVVMATALVVGIVGFAAGPGLGAVAGLGVVWLRHWQRRRRETRARNDQRRAGIAEVDALIQELKAGGSLRPSVGARSGENHLDALVATTIKVLTLRGGEALPSLERLSDTLRSAQAAEAEARAQAGQATASASVMATLPLVFVVILASVDGRLRAFYLFHPLGALCLAVALVLSHLGWWLMQRLIESAG